MMRIPRLILMLSVFCLTVMPRMVSAQTVSEEARRYLDRGQAAIEMATTPEELNDAVKEFQKAIDLAPAWPDPYYNIGMTQNKMERFDDALKNLRSYLQLAPNAGNAQEVKQIVNKIEYKKDKENQVKKTFELLGSGKYYCKTISGKVEYGEGVTSRFSTQDGVLGINSYLYYSARQDVPSYRVWSGYVKRRPEWSPWVPVHVNGRSYKYTYIYVVPTVHKRKGAYMVVEVKGTGEIISLDPIRAKTMVTSTQTMIVSEEGEAEAWGAADTSEIVEECSQRTF